MGVVVVVILFWDRHRLEKFSETAPGDQRVGAIAPPPKDGFDEAVGGDGPVRHIPMVRLQCNLGGQPTSIGGIHMKKPVEVSGLLGEVRCIGEHVRRIAGDR